MYMYNVYTLEINNDYAKISVTLISYFFFYEFNFINLVLNFFQLFAVFSNFLWALDKKRMMFFDIYSAIYCLYTVPLLTKRFKDLLTENTKRERRNFPMKERRERRKSQRRGESHARSLRNRERREIRDVHFFERRNAREQTTSGSLGASCRVPPSPRFSASMPFVSRSR